MLIVIWMFSVFREGTIGNLLSLITTTKKCFDDSQTKVKHLNKSQANKGFIVNKDFKKHEILSINELPT